MMCIRPMFGIRENGIPYEYGCGQCMPCRINKRNQWAGRLLLEAQSHPYSYFITLTYDDSHPLTAETVIGMESKTLRKVHAQNFIKRLRRYVPRGTTIRYYLVGEYGDKFQRPHYHLALFTDMEPNLCQMQIEKAWTLNQQLIGYVTVSLLEENRAQYVAQYTTKKLTSKKSFTDGRAPEFAIMSKNPPIGYDAIKRQAEKMKMVVETSMRFSGGLGDLTKIRTLKDIYQGCYRINGRLWPIDRTGKKIFLETIFPMRVSTHGTDRSLKSYEPWVKEQKALIQLFQQVELEEMQKKDYFYDKGQLEVEINRRDQTRKKISKFSRKQKREHSLQKGYQL